MYFGLLFRRAAGPTIETDVPSAWTPALSIVIICVIAFSRIVSQSPQGGIRPAWIRLFKHRLFRF